MLTLIENTTQQKESDLELYQAKVRENVKLICETLTRAFFGDYTVQVQSPEYLGELHILGMLVNSLINAYRNSTSREVKSHNEYIQALIRSLGEGLCGIDQDGRLIYINPAGEKILGWTSSELIGRHIDQTIHGHERDSSIGGSETCEILRVLKTLTAHAVEEDIFFRKDKTPIPVTYTVTPILQEGRVTGLNLAFQDITERKRIAEALKEKSAELERSNKELDEFPYIAAHDLKEP
ncbi:MAG TPA: hypothetical protein DF383_03545, partial [Deltaproteobacteria bacterium]|nr:hypothetical protein [Deltaproteobacteria bacterium]